MEEHNEESTKINLITPPDKLHNYYKTFCLMYPTEDTKSQFQNLIENFQESINVYMYEENDDQPAYKWLLDVIKYSNYVILDIDNIPAKHRDFISFLLGHDNVFWLTKGENEVYNTISKNRIYNLDWLYQPIGEQLEKR